MNKGLILLLRADELRADGTVFTRESLQKLAAHQSHLVYRDGALYRRVAEGNINAVVQGGARPN